MSTSTDMAALAREALAANNVKFTTEALPQSVRDAADDYGRSIAETLGAAEQLRLDLAAISRNADLVPPRGLARLRSDAIADASRTRADAEQRGKAAKARLIDALREAVLPAVDPSRETLDRQELALLMQGANGHEATARLLDLAQAGGADGALSVALQTSFGRTLLRQRGLDGRDFEQALEDAKHVRADLAVNHGTSEREQAAAEALRAVGEYATAATCAAMDLEAAASSAAGIEPSGNPFCTEAADGE